MCGITGFVGAGKENDLLAMLEAVKHRGPDDQGYFLKDGIGLAHTRLSILDLSASGHQPMWNDRKDIAIVFNGEIYNFKKLKEQFNLDKKYHFQSETDTEIILRLYEELGENCFDKLDGMFALAIYDFKQNRLLLAKDRFGEKPLYWGMFGETLVFGSELRALKTHPLVRCHLDNESLAQYLVREYVPTPRTIFKDIYKLEPASYLIYQNNEVVKKTFWTIPTETANISFDKAVDSLDKILDKSVGERMISDVPLGIFLSGGIDSSTLAYYAQKASKQKIKTFSIEFEEGSFDESSYAKQVANFLSTEHYSKKVTAKDSLNVLNQAILTMGEPLADPTIIPNLLLSEFTRDKVTVALGGDGADELLAGYQTFQAEKLVNLYQSMPAVFRNNLIKPLIKSLPSSDKNFNIPFKLKKFMEGADYLSLERHQRWLQAFSKEDLRDLLDGKFYQSVSEVNPYSICLTSSEGTHQDVLNSYLYSYLMDGVLSKTDRASMHYALEARAPFLAGELVEFLATLPYEYKLHGFTTKHILKELMKDKLPKNIVYRKKQGFGVPVSEWLKKDLKPMLLDKLSEHRLTEQGIFNPDYVNKVIEEHMSGSKNNYKKLWTLLVFQLWIDEFMK